LHNYDEKLCNFGATDNNESLARIMTDRYYDDEGNMRIEMSWQELVPEEGDEGSEWDEKNDPYMLEAEAKQLYSAAVTEKTNEGYTPSNDVVSSTSWNAYKLGTGFFVSYSYMQSVHSWAFITESG